MKKRYLLGSIIAATLIFSGCGGGGGGSSSSSSANASVNNVSGVVADGYIKDAKVCVDLNGDGDCGKGEPSATTDKNGNYKIQTNQNIANKPIIAVGGYDIERNTKFDSKLVSVVDNNKANVTPLTTFAYAYAKEHKKNYEEAKKEVAPIIGVNPNEIEADPNKDEKLKKVALKLQVAAETAAKIENDDPLKVYEKLAKSADEAKDLTTLVDKAFSDKPEVKAAVKVVVTEDIDPDKVALIQETIIKEVKKAKENNVSVTPDILEDKLKTVVAKTELNLSVSDFENKIKSLFDEAKLDSNVTQANDNDVKNMVKVIRDTTYEFLDPNIDDQEKNTSTIMGNYLYNYKNAITPAVEKVSKKVENSIDDINKAVEKFDSDLKENFKDSTNDLDNRISEILEKMDQYPSTKNYSFTTKYGDKVEHTYQNNNGSITEIYKINGVEFKAKYSENEIKNSYLTSNPLTISKNGEYEIKLNKINFQNNKFELDINGKIYGKNNSLIDIPNGKLTFDVDADKIESVDSLLGFKNISLLFDGKINTQNGAFTGKAVFNDTEKYIEGILDYSNFNGVKINGKLSLNTTTNKILKIINDQDNEVNYDGMYGYNFVLINNSPVGEVRVRYIGFDPNTNESKQEVNLTSLNGNKASCIVTDKWGNNAHIHTVNCDKNITSYLLNGKMVLAKLNNKQVVLYYIGDDWQYDANTQVDLHKIRYTFFDGKDDYEVEYDNGKTLLNGKAVTLNLSNIQVKNPTSVLDIPGNIKFEGSAQTKDAQLKFTLTTLSLGDGKSYNIFADNVNFNDGVNTLSVDDMEIDMNVNDDNNEHPYLTSYVSYYNSDESGEDNATKMLLTNLNAELVDKNNNPIELNKFNVLIDDKNNLANMYGDLKYLDTETKGFVSYLNNEKNKKLEAYLNVNRDGFEPFQLAGILTCNDDNSTVKTAMKKGNYLLYFEKIGEEIKGYDNHGVFITIKEENGETTVKITDKNGKELATFDPKTKTITYSDGTTETLY
jgi:fructose-specific component phosphotransferase system IIB-like protein